jgi:protein-tyrosine phosphatase
MCRTATADIGRALALVAERREVGAVLFHCAQGKDRTGVLAALLQHTVGEDEAALVESYAASADMLREHAARVGDAGRGGGGADAGRKKKGDDGVDWSSLEGSPPEAMVGTLAWLRREHGSIDGFLVEAVPGDAEVWRRRLLDAVRRPC